MLRETDHKQIVRFLLLLFSSGPPNIFHSTRVNLRLTVHSKTQRIQDGRKQIARVRFFHALMQLSDELIAWLAHTHTHTEREREIHILWQCRRCVALRFIFIPNNRNWCSSCLSHTSFSCVLALLFHSIHHIGSTYSPPLLQKHHTRRTVAKRCVKITHTKKKWLFQKGERWYGESESTTTSLCVKIQKGGGGSQQTKRVKRKVISFLFWWWCYVETASPDEKSLASLSQYE